MISANRRAQKFRVVANLEETIMTQFIKWSRYVVYDGDLAQLYLEKTKAINDAQKKKAAQNNKKGDDSSDEEDIDLDDVFKGYIDQFSKANELSAWRLIKVHVKVALEKYDTSLEEDIELLEKGDLTDNIRNCIMYRKGEKVILNFLLDCAARVEKLL